jgi:hypothetical protein
MAIQNDGTEAVQKLSRMVDTPDFVNRLAEDMKARSGSDLPLSCFIEQVRMQLAGKSPGDVARLIADRSAKRAPVPKYETSDCYRSWAMPDLQ